MSAAKDTVSPAVDGLAEELEALSRRIHDHPELGYQEKQAAAWLTEFLAAKGFKVESGVAEGEGGIRLSRRIADG
jgi:metal-dependent amidase/aminoacylase/carboxypeptidase family protein